MKSLLVRLSDHVSADRIDLVAGGVAFYALLALFPMLMAAISIYGLFTTSSSLESQIEGLANMLPDQAHTIVVDQLRSIESSSSEGLTLGAVFGFLVALWSASRGTDALISSVGIAYSEVETRSYVHMKLLSLALTLTLIACVSIAFTLVAVVPIVLSFIGLGAYGRAVAEVVRWLLLLALFMGALSAVYRTAPRAHEWRIVSWGSVIATVLWLLASFGFSFYVARFGNYQAVYGSVGGVVILLLWLWISAYVILLGAEIDFEVGRQNP
ncbi:MAG: YihY/virulence factor BrkB family protein [Polyangiaceae bacterium]|nr:YihY/virulence factor BrkB family protein [Polyangiaceae bacterium]